MIRNLLMILFFFMCTGVQVAHAIRSDFRTLHGMKYPNSAQEGDEPVETEIRAPAPGAILGGYTELLPSITRAPDQEEAGSCLYMSLTGNVEWWLSRLNPKLTPGSEGDLDLSERQMMNMSGDDLKNVTIKNWKTDSVYLFNEDPRGVILNRDYPFAKGWWKKRNGEYVKAKPFEKGATYDAAFSWIDERESLFAPTRIQIPRLERQILFEDPESNQWNTAVMPPNIVEKVKRALTQNRAPVQILYNHFGYWHAALIVGFNDEIDTQDCRFVRDFLKWAKKKNPKIHQKTQAAFDRGGCRPKGVFYVRDSIYPDPNAPLYDYDRQTSGDESNYTYPIVIIEYEWLQYLGNHAIQILAR